MKWTSKGYENIICNKNISETTKFCIYGAGKLGGDLYKTLKHYDMFFCFIDNNHSIQEKGYKNEAVISENEYFKKEIKYPVIICASDKNTLLIESDLKNRGLIHNKNYYICREFTDKLLPIIAYKFFNETFMSLSQICVTERCTLRCKKCAHGCYNVPITKDDMTLEQVKKSADIFFSKVDYIQEFVLIGGEPLLYKYLTDAVEYIGSKEFINKKEYKYILLRQLKKYILGIELHTLDKLYNISAFSLGTHKYSYENLKNKKVVIYGAGNSSESLYNYLTKECKCDITGWVDKYPEGKDMKVMHEILAVNSILNIQYDYIVIAVLKKELADSIRKELIELYNIDSKKILWNKVEYVNLLDKM